jgi:hypothetical protein
MVQGSEESCMLSSKEASKETDGKVGEMLTEQALSGREDEHDT